METVNAMEASLSCAGEEEAATHNKSIVALEKTFLILFTSCG